MKHKLISTLIIAFGVGLLAITTAAQTDSTAADPAIEHLQAELEPPGQ
jgi:hypothetical protein